MLHVKNQRYLQHLRLQMIELHVRTEHPKKILCRRKLAVQKKREEDSLLYEQIERIAPMLIAKQRKMYKGVSPNVDFYSGFVYDMLGIPVELYTPLFAIARIVGWSAHRMEELVSMDKIIRPAYKSLMVERAYIPWNERG